ncbi:MAG TPA: outer membrane beta-barrel protein [Burkholderiales bacterium]|jgi:hypothetical protein|nr:outer membrane beta-barrel protein [Burkholderiales bacterium]
MNNTGRPDEALTRIGAWARRRVGFVLLGLLVPGLAAGQDKADWKVHPYLQDKWYLQLGAYWPTVDTTARLDSTTLGRGTEISFEDELGLDDREALGSLLASVRLGERWKIEFEYFALNREGTRQISRNLQWGNTVYPVNATVSSSFDSDVYRLSAGYAFVKDDRREFGATFGLHVTDFKASLSAGGLATEGTDALAPLPTVGVYGAYAFSPRWLVTGRIDYFSLNYEEYDGSLVNVNAGVEYRFTRHFGIGAGYRYVDYEVELSKTSWTGEAKYTFKGPTLYVTGSF